MVVEAVAAEEPRCQPVEPQRLDQGRARREQCAPRPALVAPVGIAHATPEHPVVTERPGFGQEGRDCARCETTVGVEQQQVASPRPARPHVAASREPDVAVPAHQDQPRIGRSPASKLRADFGRIAVVDQNELGDPFLVRGEHRLDREAQHRSRPVGDHQDADAGRRPVAPQRRGLVEGVRRHGLRCAVRTWVRCARIELRSRL